MNAKVQLSKLKVWEIRNGLMTSGIIQIKKLSLSELKQMKAGYCLSNEL